MRQIPQNTWTREAMFVEKYLASTHRLTVSTCPPIPSLSQVLRLPQVVVQKYEDWEGRGEDVRDWERQGRPLPLLQKKGEPLCIRFIRS